MSDPNKGFHYSQTVLPSSISIQVESPDSRTDYKFENFFHPFVHELIKKINESESLAGFLDPVFLEGLGGAEVSPPDSFFEIYKDYYQKPENEKFVNAEGFPKKIDFSVGGPYANYNWELFFHIPLTIAVHLSKNQRFAEAQRWFHFIFDPTNAEGSYWRFLAFRENGSTQTARVAGAIKAGDVLTTTINGFPIAYPVVAADITLTVLASHIVSAINTTTSADPVSGRALNKVVQASNVSDIITIRALSPVTSFTLSCSVSLAATVTYTPLDTLKNIDALLRLLSTPEIELGAQEREERQEILAGYEAIKKKPFQPHAVARTRHLAYQFSVVMKYLDNLIAWGDSLFRQDTRESINEAIQIYILAANILGPKPQRIPATGTIRPKTFRDLRTQGNGLDAMGNALVDLEAKFPLNMGVPRNRESTGTLGKTPLFGIGRTLYFCVPRNDKLLGYWDTVADRLFKIRHCMNVEGIVRQLALFDPPIDPGMLVKAAAAGIDIGSAVSGLNQPVGFVRAQLLIQKALELCAEVRGLGSALLSAIEKGDGEKMALLRQSHEIEIQTRAQEVGFLKWKQAQESTELLLRGRARTLESYRYYQRLLGLKLDDEATPDTFPLDRRKLTEENFDEAHSTLVAQYSKPLTTTDHPRLSLANSNSPLNVADLLSEGQLYLSDKEFLALNVLPPVSAELRIGSAAADIVTSILSILPYAKVKVAPIGIGAEVELAIGQIFGNVGAAVTRSVATLASLSDTAASLVGQTASYQRRADEWILQTNLAAHELMQIGRQILGSLIAEQVAHHEYLSIKKQIEQSIALKEAMETKFTNEELYSWMQGELSRLYYEYYRFAFDTARKAEQTMKHELMRPEVDATGYIKFNYWDGGRKGLLSGEALHLDLKRMEMAYHENNKREYELTRHVSLRQLNPLALLVLRATGSCEVTIPEWLFDLDCPGHYMRRIKNVSLSIPSVVGPYTSLACTLSLLKSSLRKSPTGDYARLGSEDGRFVDYIGSVQSIVTSNGQNDSGLFETNLRDERFLPFEGAGAESTWKLDMPNDFRAFDYETISDVVLHIRYTARQGVEPGKVNTALGDLFEQASKADLSLLFSLRHDFPSEWSAFVNGTGNFTATIRSDYFPYFVQRLARPEGTKRISITGLDLYEGLNMTHRNLLPAGSQADIPFPLTVSADSNVVKRSNDVEVFLVLRYALI